jgi:Arc/MetJ family transcription regulator
MPSLMEEPQHWRERAEQMIELADQASDAVAKETMLSIAAAYENLATRAAERLATITSHAAPAAPSSPATGAAAPGSSA